MRKALCWLVFLSFHGSGCSTTIDRTLEVSFGGFDSTAAEVCIDRADGLGIVTIERDVEVYAQAELSVDLTIVPGNARGATDWSFSPATVHTDADGTASISRLAIKVATNDLLSAYTDLSVVAESNEGYANNWPLVLVRVATGGSTCR